MQRIIAFSLFRFLVPEKAQSSSCQNKKLRTLETTSGAALLSKSEPIVSVENRNSEREVGVDLVFCLFQS